MASGWHWGGLRAVLGHCWVHIDGNGPVLRQCHGGVGVALGQYWSGTGMALEQHQDGIGVTSGFALGWYQGGIGAAVGWHRGILMAPVCLLPGAARLCRTGGRGGPVRGGSTRR